MSTYWQRRQNMADAAMERDEHALSKRVEQVYTRELKGLEREIASYYQRYGEDNVIAYRRLMETMDPVDRDLLIRDCDKFLAVHPDMQSIVDVRKSIYKLNRLEGLQASARVHFYNVTFEVSGYVDKHLLKQSLRGANTAAEAMGFGKSFYNMDSDAVRRFVDTVWTGNTSYSQRIWDNTETLASYVSQDMAKAFARGDSYQRIAKALEKRFVDVPQSSLMRLVYTEGTYVSRMAQAEELKREGFDSYTIQAVHDGRTCEQCHGVEGKTFRFEDMQVGVNFPPLHPYCRCQIAPAVDDWDAWQQKQEEFGQRQKLARVEENEAFVKAKKGGKNRYSVNYKRVNTKEYHDKFGQLPVPKPVQEQLYIQTGRMLQELDGTPYERLVALDARTGDLVADTYSHELVKLAANFNKDELKIVRKHKNGIVLLHNHPGDSYPSLSDIYSAMMTEGVSGSLVSGHGGTVYYIEPIKLHGFEERYSILLEEAKQFTTEIERAQLIAFIRLEEENEVKKWYRVLKI
ncbi:minor capsid protein [Lancefieldella rimae]|uniref:Phage protein F-like protein n=2 Tax=Lancefieldella rimae TaxID=1383 RepID=B9CN47_LANR4|nr:minor capsid protein [Lancefieldella rimae]EEE16952.1 phage protein F-like protein [Lancefieldella rimae ATCC 49626]